MQLLSSSSLSFHLQTFPFLINPHLLPPKTLKFQSFKRIFFKEKSNLKSSTIRCGNRKSSFGDRNEDDKKKHNTKKTNIAERTKLFDVELLNFSISFPAMLILSRKQQISGMIHHLVSSLKKNIVIVVKPAAAGGADIGIKWYIGM
ncbi:hypothetical protein KSP40_PGU009907 [Platanthera guangdongensis]|uniref:Uncharacterized protein n=1 Tax=Platanthera guangdongensis TaxID=2320717 RepID=A0ABR2MMI3_9ASPA